MSNAAWFYSSKPLGPLREAANNKEYIRFGQADATLLEATFQEFQDFLLPFWRSDTESLPSAPAKSVLPSASELPPATTVTVR